MPWITPERDYLVEGKKCSLPQGVTIASSDGSTPLCPAKFYLIDERGEVKSAYSEPLEYGIDNEHGVTNIHAVVGDTLLSYYWKEFVGPVAPPDEITSRVILTGLRSIARDELPFDPQQVIAAFENG
jgi:hypothetical protein